MKENCRSHRILMEKAACLILAAVFRYFLQKISLQEMIRHATDNGFWEKIIGT